MLIENIRLTKGLSSERWKDLIKSRISEVILNKQCKGFQKRCKKDVIMAEKGDGDT